ALAAGLDVGAHATWRRWVCAAAIYFSCNPAFTRADLAGGFAPRVSRKHAASRPADESVARVFGFAALMDESGDCRVQHLCSSGHGDNGGRSPGAPESHSDFADRSPWHFRRVLFGYDIS